MFTYIENDEHYDSVIENGLLKARKSVWIATANVKDLRIAWNRQTTKSIVDVLLELHEKGLDIRLLHAGKASRVFTDDLLNHSVSFPLRACKRVHFKTLIFDGRSAYSGSANLTGAALGMKSPRKRNFETGFLTQDTGTVDRLQSLFNLIWEGAFCDECVFFKKNCPGLRTT